MADDYKFYIKRYVNNAWEEEVSITDYFTGLHYCKCSGLSDYGKIKNIYTESYAETDELRLYIPAIPVRENTDIEFEFAFSGDNRRDVYDSFVEWLSGYKLYYHDTLRKRTTHMVLIEAVEITDDYLYGNELYLVAKFKFKNIYGQTEKVV